MFINKTLQFYATLPLNCSANFDLKLIDLFAKLKNKSIPIKERLKEEYFTIKEKLNKNQNEIVNIFELFENTNYSVRFYIKNFGTINSYFDFLNEINELKDINLFLYQNNILNGFLTAIEITAL